VSRTLKQLLEDYERILIVKTLHANSFSRKRAAEALGIKTGRLWRRMRVLKIDISVLPRTTPGRPRRKGGGPPPSWIRLSGNEED